MGWRAVMAVLLTAAMTAMSARAWAQDDPPADAAKLPTLHVYTDLVQVPVLVLDPSMAKMKPVEEGRFRVSLDGGPEFKPKRVRMEGEDPIRLGILLDVTGDQSRMMAAMGEALAGLTPKSLTERDHVSIYMLNCVVTWALKDAPADGARLKAGVALALAPWQAEQKEKHKPKCEKRVGLWDAIRMTAQDMAGVPGRQVLLAVTDGVDRGTSVDADERRDRARATAQAAGIAVFAIAPTAGVTTSESVRGSPAFGGRGVGGSGWLTSSARDGLSEVCWASGGVVLRANRLDLAQQMVRFVELVRGRYILEFARPRNGTPGEHGIVVSIFKTPAFVKPAGVSILVGERAVKDDIEGIAPDRSDAPELGKGKPPKP